MPFCKNLVFLQVIGFYIKQATDFSRTNTDRSAFIGENVWPFAAELRRGSFAGFVVMLGGVKTKDVLSLT